MFWILEERHYIPTKRRQQVRTSKLKWKQENEIALTLKLTKGGKGAKIDMFVVRHSI